MAPSTFHRFSQLPTELRLEIWKLAIRPTDGKHGIHHFTIIDQEQDAGDSFELLHPHCRWDPPTPPYKAIVQVGQATQHGNPTTLNKSAYLWDRGLWTACTESRDIMMTHFKVTHWDQRRIHQGLGPSISFCLHFELNRVGDVSYPANTTVRRGQENWRLMVRPILDLFCFTSENWAFARNFVDWSDFFASLPFTSYLHCHEPVRHIAFEFDPSWNIDFPVNIYDLLAEPSARGFVARTLESLARDHLLYSMYQELWLIDRAINWEDMEHRQGHLVFYDCEEDFVEVKWDQIGMNEHEKTCTHFIEQLARIGDQNFTWAASHNGPGNSIWSWTKDRIRILACRRNQIVPEARDNGS